DIPRNALDRRRFLQLMGMAGAGVALGACGGGGSTATTSSPTSSVPKSPPFPIGAAAKATNKPVPVTMWHSMTEANLKTLQTLAKQFNASQSDVKVSLVNQTSYSDTMTAYTTAAGSNDLPDLVQIENIDLRIMIDSNTVIPAGDAVAADNFNLSTLLPSAVEFFKVENVLWGMPWNESSQILYYNKKAFAKAGLDPATPPATLAEYKSAAQKIVSSGACKYGTSLKLTPSEFEDWFGQAGQQLVNNGNGRTARATAVTFGGSVGLELFSFYEEMFTSKLAQATPGNGSGAYDNLLAIAGGTAAMTTETSAALGTVLTVLPHYPAVELGVGPLPAPPGPGGVPYGGAGLFMVKSSPAERQDGSWQFIKFLLGPSQMATWSLGSGYIPIVTAAVQVPALTKAWATTPAYKVAYNQVLSTQPSIATAGAVAGALDQVETYVTNGLTAISNGTSAASALATTVSQSNSAIASYNSRV
ncbi:MAG TPA: extracellular solute-binding protein, partial [Acidimicrobiales bacterium]|nr:extracellular solute-binding protein [Acidimicrobiales bacterium]